MKWTLIGVPALLVSGACITGSAQALPSVPLPERTAAAQPAPLLSIRYHRHYWYHRYRSYHRHYGYSRHRHQRLARSVAPEGSAAGLITPGRWEFVTQLQTGTRPELQAGAAPTQAAQALSGGGVQTSYSGCITAERAVPAELGPQCTLDTSQRDGPALTWSMTCRNAQGAVRSDGQARYAGETMEGRLVNHLPGADGKVIDMTQRITGRYLGPCTEARR